LLETLELLGFSGLAFWYFRFYMTAKAKISLDIDWLYRISAPWLRRYMVTALNDGFALAETFALHCSRRLSALASNPLVLLPNLAARRPAQERRWKGRPDRAYDPDRYRAPIGFALLIALASFISLLGWDLVSALFLP
jgi:multicomponent Na+:H+ antiporter subunit D